MQTTYRNGRVALRRLPTTVLLSAVVCVEAMYMSRDDIPPNHSAGQGVGALEHRRWPAGRDWRAP